jgi:hypothetical protein
MPYRNIRLRYPYEVFLLIWCFLVAAPAALGMETSGAAAQAMSPLEVRLWSISLAVGAAVALTGIFWSRGNAKSQMTGLTLEQVGLIIVGFGAAVYGVVIMKVTGATATFALGIVWGFSTASFAQAFMLYKAMKRSVSAQKTYAKGVHG